MKSRWHCRCSVRRLWTRPSGAAGDPDCAPEWGRARSSVQAGAAAGRHPFGCCWWVTAVPGAGACTALRQAWGGSAMGQKHFALPDLAALSPLT